MNWFNNLKISVKLAIGFGVSLLAIVITIMVSDSNSSKIDQMINDINNVQFPKTVWANNVVNMINEESKSLRDLVLTTNQQAIQDLMSKYQADVDSANENYDSLSRAINTPDGKALLAKVIQQRDKYKKEAQSVLDQIQAGNKDSALAALYGGFRIAEHEYLNGINDLIKLQAKRVSDEANIADQSSSNAKTTLFIIGGLTFLLILSLGLLISSGIVKSLKIVADRLVQLQSELITNLGEGLLALSKGDLSAKVEKDVKQLNFTRTDEIGLLAITVDKVIAQSQGSVDAYEIVRAKINQLSNETLRLIDTSKEGKLDNRGDLTKFEGFYKNLLYGFNSVLDAIIMPIKEGARVLEIFANGDFTHRVTAEYKGDHQLITNSINKLGDSVGSVLAEVSEAVSATASASTQISSSSEEMAAGSQEQSSQAQEVAAAVEQMTKTILETTKNAGSTANEAKNAGKIAKDGGKVISETIEGMNRIATVVTKAAETVQELGKSSDQIGEIVQVIDDIADQTNLLALNAAIEAARAGEQGRGFAVVADEVRKLAERTTKATKEIADMIKRIQKDTNGAVESIQQGTTEVQRGKDLAAKAGESLEQIITGSAAVVDSAMQVAAASEEQSASAEQISKNIEAISSVTQQSAAGTQQIARAAEDLNRLTDNLQNIVSKFKIDNNERRDNRSTLAVRSNGHIVHAN
ncbi:MAG: methyl-accepting chemotaxis protein [Ignavibacteriaceae bacterium]